MVESDGTSKLVEQFERLNKQFHADYCVKYYLNQAQRLVGAVVTEKTNPDLLALIGHCKSALAAIESKDINSLVYNFNWVHQFREKLNIPAFQAQGVNINQKEIARKDRRPQMPTRVVLYALNAGYKSKSEVENFLSNESRLTDGWGTIDIKAVKGGFELTDTDRNFTERTLKTSRIATQISETIKRYYD
jgi:hypothetical protein